MRNHLFRVRYGTREMKRSNVVSTHHDSSASRPSTIVLASYMIGCNGNPNPADIFHKPILSIDQRVFSPLAKYKLERWGDESGVKAARVRDCGSPPLGPPARRISRL